MRSRVLSRRRAGWVVVDPGSGLAVFEFAHLLDAVSAGIVLEPLLEPDREPDVEPDAEPDAEPAVVVSRFADCGLDDDRLPVAVKRRRARRR